MGRAGDGRPGGTGSGPRRLQRAEVAPTGGSQFGLGPGQGPHHSPQRTLALVRSRVAQ